MLIGLIIIVGLSLVIILQSLWPRREDDLEQKEEGLSYFRVAAYISLRLLYGFFFEDAGFMISSTLFLVLILRVVENKSWEITVLVGFLYVIVRYMLFPFLLGIPLPQGWLEGF